jgi:alkanesulfonate monooxygenase SsuD/methylene tetrahydromethanopterin reductase-like flavin-dependent oxidoreductase (luciferase family)
MTEFAKPVSQSGIARSVHDSRKVARFGVHAAQLHATLAPCLELWRRAEASGYEWVSVFDHLRPHLYSPDWPCYEGSTLLAMLAARTDTVRCAILVSSAAWRHPAILANIASTVDHISGGRLEFGIGAGGPDRAYAQYGIPSASPAVRIEMLEETCRIMRSLLSEVSTTFHGKHFTLDNAYVSPKPLQSHIPLVVAAEGNRAIRIAAEHGDIWNCRAFPLAEYRDKVRTLERHRATTGREVRQSITFRALLRRQPAHVWAQSVAALRDLPDEVRREYVTVGTPEQCIADLKEYADLGVRDFLLAVRAPVDWETLDLIASEVAPALRRYVSADLGEGTNSSRWAAGG